MKKVILTKKVSEVYLSDLSDSSIIGCQTTSGNKFALSRTEYKFEFVGNTNLLSTSKTQYVSLYDALQGSGSLFVFDTTKELFKWMSE